MDEKKKRKLIKRYFKSKGVSWITILIGLSGLGMIVFGDEVTETLGRSGHPARSHCSNYYRNKAAAQGTVSRADRSMAD